SRSSLSKTRERSSSPRSRPRVDSSSRSDAGLAECLACPAVAGAVGWPVVAHRVGAAECTRCQVVAVPRLGVQVHAVPAVGAGLDPTTGADGGACLARGPCGPALRHLLALGCRLLRCRLAVALTCGCGVRCLLV